MKGELATLAIAGAFAVSLFATTAMAGSSSKFAAQLSRLSLIAETTAAVVEVFSATIKTPNKHDLLVGVSLEGGLFTQTKVTGKNGGGGSAEATAGIAVRVLVDGAEAEPGVVTFTLRFQKLSAVLGGSAGLCFGAAKYFERGRAVLYQPFDPLQFHGIREEDRW